MKATFSIVFSNFFFFPHFVSVSTFPSFFLLVFLVRSFISLFSHMLFKSGCILHKLTRFLARMIACDRKNNEQEQTQTDTRKHVRLTCFVYFFSLSMQFLSISFFPSPFFFSVSSLSLLHVRAAMAAQSVILITLLTMIIIIFFLELFINCHWLMLMDRGTVC